MPNRKKKSKYEWVHRNYISRWARTYQMLAIKAQYAMRKYGHVDKGVIQQLGAYRLDDPIMPELYDTLNLFHNMHGHEPGPEDVKRLYLVIKGKRENSHD